MNTTIQEKNEPAFHAYLKKAQASPNTIRSCMAACRLYYSLYDDLTHSFRHRFAKNFLEKFNDISLLADLMGHESIETTRIYLTKSTQEQRELIDKIVTW